MTGPTPLTKRQREVLAAYEANGHDREATAKALGLTPSAVRWTMSHIAKALAPLAGEDTETPAEAKARVAREIADGTRCHCALLRPCADHQP